MPHRTTWGPAAGAPGPWHVSQVMWANFLQFVPPGGVPFREVAALARLVNLAGLQRWGYLVVAPDGAAGGRRPRGRTGWSGSPRPGGGRSRSGGRWPARSSSAGGSGSVRWTSGGCAPGWAPWRPGPRPDSRRTSRCPGCTRPTRPCCSRGLVRRPGSGPRAARGPVTAAAPEPVQAAAPEPVRAAAPGPARTAPQPDPAAARRVPAAGPEPIRAAADQPRGEPNRESGVQSPGEGGRQSPGPARHQPGRERGRAGPAGDRRHHPSRGAGLPAGPAGPGPAAGSALPGRPGRRVRPAGPAVGGPAVLAPGVRAGDRTVPAGQRERAARPHSGTATAA